MLFRKVWLVALVASLVLSLLPVTHQVMAQATTCGDVYIVQQGDTLREIAARCGLSVQAVLDLNPFIEDRNVIYAGWILELRATSSQVVIPQTGAGPASDALYVVKAGDSLPYISSRLDIAEDDLLAANPSLNRSDTLRTGQIIRLSTDISSPAAAVSPQVVDPGQEVTIVAGGFPANTTLEFAAGPLGAQGVLLRQARTDNSGWLRTTVQIPANAVRGQRWVIVAHLANNPNVRALTNLLYVVNTSGPAEPIAYTVRRNDTLSGIAARFGISMQAILNVNPQIVNPRVITVGQEILIPGALMRQQPVAGQAGIFLGPNNGPPGSEIELFGAGFPVDTAIELRIVSAANQTEILAATDIQSSARGTFYTTLDIPTNARQNQELLISAELVDDAGIDPPIARFFVSETGIPQTGAPTLLPNIQLDPGRGPAGTIFSVSVTGYPANMPINLGIGISQASPNLTYAHTTSDDGSFFARIQVPQSAQAGSYYTIQITPQQTSAQPVMSVRFDVTR